MDFVVPAGGLRIEGADAVLPDRRDDAAWTRGGRRGRVVRDPERLPQDPRRLPEHAELALRDVDHGVAVHLGDFLDELATCGLPLGTDGRRNGERIELDVERRHDVAVGELDGVGDFAEKVPLGAPVLTWPEEMIQAHLWYDLPRSAHVLNDGSVA